MFASNSASGIITGGFFAISYPVKPRTKINFSCNSIAKTIVRSRPLLSRYMKVLSQDY